MLNKFDFSPDSNQIQSFLIINEFNMMPIDRFQVVFFLFQFENVLDEKLLQILVGKIDAKLLKRIRIEIFKTKNIQNANTCSIDVFDSRVRFENGCVDLFHNVDEHATVDSWKIEMNSRQIIDLALLFSLLKIYNK